MKISDFLFFDENGNVSSRTNTFILYPNESGKLYSIVKMNIFKNIYNLCKTRLGARFNGIGDTFSTLSLNSEVDFLNYSINKTKFFTLQIFLDLPVFFYHDDNDKLEEIILKQGLLLSFSSIKDYKFGSNYGISIDFQHNFFSNHIATLETFGTNNPELYNIEPASIINRLKIRNLALEIKATMPFLEIEFSAYKTRIEPYDNFGFLEGADLVV